MDDAAVDRNLAMLDELRASFRTQKRLGDAALAQLDDAGVNLRLDAEANTVAVLVKHMRGNFLSRWTDFLSSDGEKPWRERDEEFEAEAVPLAVVLAWWEEGWSVALAALDGLQAGDLARDVSLRGERLSVPAAVLRQLTHASYHVGQLVLLAKHARGDAWETLSIARGGSRAFNDRMRERHGGGG